MTTQREAFEIWARQQSLSSSYASPLIYVAWRTAWQAGTLAERAACKLACEAEHVGTSVNDACNNVEDATYNLALQHAAAAISARGTA